MNPYRPPRIDGTKVLTRRELAAVLAELARKAPRSKNTRLNLVIFRLAACCGLRASEIAGLRVMDVQPGGRPYLRVPATVAKGGRARVVPVWWDAGTLQDLAQWKSERLAAGAESSAPFVACQQPTRLNTPLSRHTLRKRFRTACKVLGTQRLSTLTIHHGRHTFLSHALAGGRTIAEVRDAAGHANITITSAYLHVVIDEDETVGRLFEYGA